MCLPEPCFVIAKQNSVIHILQIGKSSHHFPDMNVHAGKALLHVHNGFV